MERLKGVLTMAFAGSGGTCSVRTFTSSSAIIVSYIVDGSMDCDPG